MYMIGFRAQFRLDICSLTPIHPSLCVGVSVGLAGVQLVYRLSQ